MAAHSRLMTASGGERWMLCAASAVVSADLPRKSNLAAATGTLKHDLCHRAYIANMLMADFLGATFEVEGFHITVDGEFIDHCQYYLDYITVLIAPSDTVLLEHRMDLSPITGEEGAVCTADLIILRDDTLIIVDAKFGQVPVRARSTQLAIYLMNARKQFDFAGEFTKFEAHICQPPIDHIDVVEYSVEELDALEKVVREKAERVLEAEKHLTRAHFNPSGEACKYCPAADTCKPLANYLLNLLRDDVTDMSKPIEIHERDMDRETLANVMRAIPLIKSWLDKVEERVFNELRDGNDVPGFKLVAGRKGTRAWANPEVAQAALEEILGDNAYERKLVTPTTVEKMLKKEPEWEQLQSLITQPEGKPTVVPSSDKRPALSGISSTDFE